MLILIEMVTRGGSGSFDVMVSEYHLNRGLVGLKLRCIHWYISIFTDQCLTELALKENSKTFHFSLTIAHLFFFLSSFTPPISYHRSHISHRVL